MVSWQASWVKGCWNSRGISTCQCHCLNQFKNKAMEKNITGDNYKKFLEAENQAKAQQAKVEGTTYTMAG